MKSSDGPVDIKKSDFLFFSLVILLVAIDLRICLLSLKPFHSDEGVNAHFMLQLIREGKYNYDPANYHGPLIYFVTFLLQKLFGLSDFTLRFSPVLFSIGQLILIFALRVKLRRPGVLTALVLMGFSPHVIYFARTFIHETYFVSMSMAVYIFLFLLFEKRNVRFLIPAAVAVALLITIKETFIITLACLGAAAPAAWLLAPKSKLNIKWRLNWRDTLDASILAIYGGLALCVFLLIYLLLYSSFFKNPNGPWDALVSLFLWKERGSYDHVKNFFYYLDSMQKFELPSLILAILGIIHALRKRSFFHLYLAFWTLATFLAYSLIHYKTPWLLLNILLPATLSGSAAVGDISLHRITSRTRRETFALFLFVIAAWSGAQSVEANFFKYDNDQLPMVYVQTYRSYKHLFPIWNIFHDKYGDETKTAVLSPSYWPLPWSLRDHKTVGYYSKLTPNLEDHPFLITEDSQRVETRKIYGETHHKLEMPFALYPGFDLYLWIRKDLWEDTFGDETWQPYPKSS